MEDYWSPGTGGDIPMIPCSRQRKNSSVRFGWLGGRGRRLYVIFIDVYKMASLLCECGDDFRAQCHEQASSLSFAWVLLLVYVASHMLYVCTRDDSDDDECESTMYS